ncbi:hypothetical protein JZO78_15055 [Enterococcus ureilyticus]|uniref:hypothetical protein n=1 Tax=Enterococcus ureilyticus TaxID=1131292 RepID=UPI001A920020|nr:hypothetical protein [Enterococcus ureilyticus]MBO0447649.1 hypothetical protein [Enterococcus ureilyticus]
MSSASILEDMRKVKEKRNKMESYVSQLNPKKVSSKHLAKRDKSKMDGEKYKEQHEQTKTIISACAKSVNAEKNRIVSAMNIKISAYDIELVSLQNSYTIACINEENQREKDRKDAEKAKNKK